MTMHINLSKEMEAFVKDKVSGGFYGNATEVIRDALRRMQDEEARIRAFQAAVAEGEADIERGEYFTWTDSTMDEIVGEVLAEIESSGKRSRG